MESTLLLLHLQVVQREAHFRINECSCGLSNIQTCKITSLKCYYHNIDRVIYSIANAPSHNRGLVIHSKFMLLSYPGLPPESGSRHQVDRLQNWAPKNVFPTYVRSPWVAQVAEWPPVGNTTSQPNPEYHRLWPLLQGGLPRYLRQVSCHPTQQGSAGKWEAEGLGFVLLFRSQRDAHAEGQGQEESLLNLCSCCFVQQRCCGLLCYIGNSSFAYFPH
jgi:hypothetical protein